MIKKKKVKKKIPSSLKVLIEKYENSNSIRQRTEYHDLIEATISKIVEQFDSWDKDNSSWYFPDAEEGEVGTIKSALATYSDNRVIEIIVDNGRTKEYRYINLNTLEVD